MSNFERRTAGNGSLLAVIATGWILFAPGPHSIAQTDPPPNPAVPLKTNQIEVIGATDLQLTQLNESEKLKVFTLPINASAGDVFKDVTILTIQIASDKNLMAPNSVTAKLVPRPEKNVPQMQLQVDVDLTTLSESGDYVATFQAFQGAKYLQQFQLKFHRPYAQLKSVNPVRIEEVVYFPSIWVSTNPGSALLAETTGKSFCKMVGKNWIVDLAATDGQPRTGRVDFTFPSSIDAWSQKEVPYVVKGNVPFGTSHGTLVLRSANLADSKVELPVQVVRRLHPVWLLAMIIACIFLGYFVRTTLADRGSKLDARIRAAEALKPIQDAARETGDQSLRDKLKAITKDLQQAANARTATADSIKDATKTATDKFQDCLRTVETTRGKLATQIAEWRVALGSKIGQPNDIATLIDEFSKGLDQQEDKLNARSVDAVQSFVDNTVSEWPAKFEDQISKWQDPTSIALHQIDDWPGTKLKQCIDQLKQFISEIANKGPPNTRELVQQALLDTRKAFRMTSKLIGIGKLDLANLGALLSRMFGEVVESLGDPQDDQHAAALAAFHQERANLDTIVQDIPSSVKSMEKLAIIAKQLAEQIESCFRAVFRFAGADISTALNQKLANRDFRSALGDLETELPSPAPMSHIMSATHSSSIVSAQLVRQQVVSPAKDDLVSWAVQIKLPSPSACVSESVTATAEISTTDKKMAGQVQYVWALNGKVIKRSPLGDNECRFAVAQPGKVVIRVQASSSDGSSHGAASAALEVVGASDEEFTLLHDQLAHTKKWQNVISGLLIALTGYTIFRNTFLGRPDDFLAAGLWGFSADIGLAKVLELAQPFTALKPRLATSQAGSQEK